MFITCSSVLLDLLVPGKFYCWNPATWSLDSGPTSLLTAAPTEPVVGPGPAGHRHGPSQQTGPVLLHGAAPRLPPSFLQARGDLPQLFRPWFPDPWWADGFRGQRVAPLRAPAGPHAGLGCTEVPKTAREPHPRIEAAVWAWRACQRPCLMLSFTEHLQPHRLFPRAACGTLSAPATLYISLFKDIGELKKI